MNEQQQQEIDRIERERRRREEALFLLLLFVVGGAATFADGTTRRNPRNTRARVLQAIDHGIDPIDAVRRVVAGDAGLHLPGLVGPLTNAIAEAFGVGYAEAFTQAGVPLVLPEYDATPFHTMAAKVAEDLIQSLGLMVARALAEVADLTTPQRMRYVGDQFTRYGFTRGEPQTINPLSKGTPGFALAGVATETILSAWNDGLFHGYFAPPMIERKLVLGHVSVIDDGTTDICRERDGLTLYANDPYWRRNWPKLHPRCRSLIVVRSDESDISERYPVIPPMPGFGAAPAAAFGFTF